MLISGSRIDDFKTERKELAPPLPMVLRLVPILFYSALAFLAVIGSLSLYQAKMAENRREEIRKQLSALEAEILSVKARRDQLGKEIRRATDLEAWVLGSMPLQSLAVEIIRSMGPRSSIVDLTIERDPATPSQLRLALRLNTDSDKQLEATLEAIRRLNYREFSPTQTMVRGDLEYKAKLLWENPAGQLPQPEDRGK